MVCSLVAAVAVAVLARRGRARCTAVWPSLVAAVARRGRARCTAAWPSLAFATSFVASLRRSPEVADMDKTS